MIKKMMKKPVEVEVLQWTGENADEVHDFVRTLGWINGRIAGVATIEGGMARANIGDWIVRGHSEKYGYYFWTTTTEYLNEFYE